METKLSRTLKVTTLAALIGLTAGCANNSELTKSVEAAKAAAESAQQDC